MSSAPCPIPRPLPAPQIEKKYGYSGKDKVYLRHLVAKARQHLGPELLLYTTDTASNEGVARHGTLEDEWTSSAC
jgi:hypothetical protein